MSVFTDIVFDLDGTIVDSLLGIELSARAAITEVYPGRDVPPLRRFIGPPIREVFRHALCVNDPIVLDALVASFRAKYDSIGWRKTELFSGADSTLRRLRKQGIHLFVLTNKPEEATERILRHHSIWELFDRVVAPSNGTVDHDKVHAAKVLKIIARLPSATTLLVGDSSDDASAAAACEFSFAAVAFGYGNAAVQTIEPVQYRIATFSDILTLIKPQLIL